MDEEEAAAGNLDDPLVGQARRQQSPVGVTADRRNRRDAGEGLEHRLAADVAGVQDPADAGKGGRDTGMEDAVGVRDQPDDRPRLPRPAGPAGRPVAGRARRHPYGLSRSIGR